MSALKINTLPRIETDFELIKSDSVDVSTKIRETIKNVLENKDCKRSIQENLAIVLQNSEDIFSDEKVDKYIAENILCDTEACGDAFYYRKIIEDLFHEYVFNRKQRLPEYLLVNGESEHYKHLTLNQMLKIISMPQEFYDSILDEKEKEDVENVVSVIHSLLYAIQQRSSIEQKEQLIQSKAKKLIALFDSSIKQLDRRANNENSYENNETVIEISEDMNVENGLKTRYLLQGPLTIKSNKENYISQPKEFLNESIKVQSITFREKSIRRQILNSLGGKNGGYDTIGLRIGTDSIEDAYNFYQTVLKSPEIINSSVKMFRKTEDLVDFDAKDLEKFKERMNQLIAIENKMVSNTGSVVGGELDKFDILGSNNRNIKEVLEDLGDQKNQVFEKYKEYELYVKQYYKLLREASKLRKRNYLSDPAYEEAILKASELNNRIISFREIELAPLEEDYNRKLLHWRKILIIDNDNIHGAVTSGNGDKEKLKSNAKPFIKFIVEKLGGEDKLVDMLYTKKEGKMGSSLYLSSKIQIDLGDGVYAEIAALPTWLMTLGELVAPHEGYSKQKIDNIKAPLGRILKKLSNK